MVLAAASPCGYVVFPGNAAVGNADGAAAERQYGAAAMAHAIRAGTSTLREDVMADARTRIRAMADRGFTIGEITARFRGEMSELEHELVWRLARAEMHRARRDRWSPSSG